MRRRRAPSVQPAPRPLYCLQLGPTRPLCIKLAKCPPALHAASRRHLTLETTARPVTPAPRLHVPPDHPLALLAARCRPLQHGGPRLPVLRLAEDGLRALRSLLVWLDIFKHNLIYAPCLTLSMCRVAFRAYRVLSKPVEELVNLLGLEVPVAPLVSLAGIKADGALLHWKPPDHRSSVVKYVIRINGIDSGLLFPSTPSELTKCSWRCIAPGNIRDNRKPPARPPLRDSHCHTQ